MPDEEWIKTIADGRRVKFTSQELPGDRAFITAQIETNKVVYSILLAKAKNPLSRKEVERHFEAELVKR
ncbi:MAG: hypothetical protein WB755_17175 [Terriglobales bacterium]